MKKPMLLVAVVLGGMISGVYLLRSGEAPANLTDLDTTASAPSTVASSATADPTASASMPPGHEVAPAPEQPPRGRDRELSAAERKQHLERATRLLSESIPWLRARREGAERAGRQDEARALALRAERLEARLALVARGIDPDQPTASPEGNGAIP